jgi:hypothetical protein
VPFVDPRRPPPSRSVTRSGFARLWRVFLPGAIALMGLAIVSGVTDPDAGPAWIFALGAAFAVIGAASFLRHLWEQGLSARRSADSTPPGSGR